MGKVQVFIIPKRYVDLSKLVIVLNMMIFINGTFRLHFIAVRNGKGNTLLLIGWRFVNSLIAWVF